MRLLFMILAFLYMPASGRPGSESITVNFSSEESAKALIRAAKITLKWEDHDVIGQVTFKPDHSAVVVMTRDK